MTGARLGVDVGGTFTDLVALVDGELVTVKVPSTPADQSEGAMRAVAVAGLEPGDVAAFAHGMTVATNALLERRGARTALVTTEGFRDVLEIARQNRPSLYDLSTDRPPALVPRELRFTVRERMGPEGPGRAAGPRERRARRERRCGTPTSRRSRCACCSPSAIPSTSAPSATRSAQALPDVHVSLSSEVLPEFREYERFATTTADAYLAPRLAAYLRPARGARRRRRRSRARW